MMLSCIVAVSENGVLGRKGLLPWRLSADLKHFKSVTMGHPLFMGRKTHESIGRVLPGRINVVISRDINYKAEGCVVATSFQHGIELIGFAEKKCFVIGGGEIYQLAMPLVEEIYLTRVHANIEGDVYFPRLIEKEWEKVEEERHSADEKNEFDYSFCRYVRR